MFLENAQPNIWLNTYISHSINPPTYGTQWHQTAAEGMSAISPSFRSYFHSRLDAEICANPREQVVGLQELQPWNNEFNLTQLAEYQLGKSTTWNGEFNLAELAQYQLHQGNIGDERIDLAELAEYTLDQT